jgi:hypothetical protein
LADFKVRIIARDRTRAPLAKAARHKHSGDGQRAVHARGVMAPAASDGARGACPIERVARAPEAHAAGGRDACLILKLFEAGAAGPGVAGDLGIGDAVAQADDHGLVPAARGLSRVMLPEL